MTHISEQYDAIVQAHPDEMREAVSCLRKEMERRDCKFGDQIIPTFLKPVFLSSIQIEAITSVIRHVMSILEKVTRLYFTHPQLRGFYYINDTAKELMEIDHGYSKNIIISRPDAFLIDDVLRFVEFNCDSPAGAGYCDVEEKIFFESFPLKQIQSAYTFNYKNRMECLLNALLDAYSEFAGKGKAPNIAIVDWRDVRTQNEFRILQSFFKERGLKTVIADPRELKFISGRLQYNNVPIDLVYRRVIFRELIEKIDEVQGFIEGYRKGKVCVVNPIRSRLASNKAILAIITNQRRFRDLFTDEENRIIKKHIPWTRRFIDIKVHFDDNEVFLKKHVLTHKNSLVLKPSDSYGGKNVAIGCEAKQADWEELIERILRNKEDWVVQKYVPITEMKIPVVSDGKIIMQTKKFNLNPFIFGGEYAGCLARLSDQSVINISSGGGMVPAMCYTKKP